MDRPDKDSALKARYHSYIGRMDSAQRAAWDAFYQPIIDDFYARDLKGKNSHSGNTSAICATTSRW